MALSSSFFCFIFLGLMILASPALVSADGRFISHVGGGRSLLQTKKSCTVDLEHQNYTIITSQCKGPDYPVNSCCTALKEFACPFAAYINDQSTKCSDDMFVRIRLSGGYPPGLFAAECREGKDGLDCSNVNVPPASLPSEETAADNGCRIATTQSIWLLISIVSLLIIHNL